MRQSTEELAMSITRRAIVLVVTWVSVVLLTVSAADARPKKKGIRAEIAALKARIAQLESRVDFEARKSSTITPEKFPMAGICGDPCATDSDGDGLGDCNDLCPCDATNTDGDADGIPDCADPCADDPSDACIDPCRTDGDGDGIVDCKDPCPWSGPGDGDADADGVPDCADPCPDDKANDCSTVCALDADGDGAKDCIDPCPWGETMGAPCVLPPTGVEKR